jgi:hypothetical protein
MIPYIDVYLNHDGSTQVDIDLGSVPMDVNKTVKSICATRGLHFVECSIFMKIRKDSGRYYNKNSNDTTMTAYG